MDSEAVKRYWLSIDNEDSAIRVYPAADVWVRRLIDGRRFLEHVIAIIASQQKSIAIRARACSYTQDKRSYFTIKSQFQKCFLILAFHLQDDANVTRCTNLVKSVLFRRKHQNDRILPILLVR